MRFLLIILVFTGITSCSTFKPNHIDWTNAPKNPSPYGPWGVTTNHYNLKGDVKEAYRVVYLEKDSTYIKSALYLFKFDKKGRLTSSRKGIFLDLGKEETYHYPDENDMFYALVPRKDSVYKRIFHLNKRGEFVKKTPQGSEFGIKYDLDGNFVQNRNISGKYGVEYKYDNRNRLVRKKAFNKDGNLSFIEEYSYSTRGSNLVVTISVTKKNNETSVSYKFYDKYGYKIGGIDSINSPTNEIIRDVKGNVVKDYCGKYKRHFLIKYWDGTSSGEDPRLDLIKKK